MDNLDRPAGVPASATWDAGDREWVLAQHDAEGELHGLVTYYRPDGTRCCATEFVSGTPHGAFERFHENQESSRTGTYVEGALHGTNVFTRSTAPTTENFPRGLGSNIWRCEMDYVGGEVTEGRLYDRQNRRVKEDGELFPEVRPAGVPSDAHYRKPEGHDDYRWVSGRTRDNNDGTIAKVGSWKIWTEAGVLIVEELYEDGEPHGTTRHFDEESGELLHEYRYDHGTRLYDRPANVPAEAALDSDDETWTVAAPTVEGHAHGESFVWSIDGVLRSSETYRAGSLERIREFLADGTLAQDSSIVDNNVPLRKFFRRTPDEELASFPNVQRQHPTALEVEYLFDPHGMMSGYAIRGEGGALLENEHVYRDAGNREAQARFATIEEAAQAWIAAGESYTGGLNKWLGELYDTGEPTFEEPTFERRDLERAVIEGVVALNERGQGERAHSTFPLFHDGIGKAFWDKYGLVADRVLHSEAGTFARLQPATRPPEVVLLANHRIQPVPGVIAFGASPDKRATAFAYDDRIEVRTGGAVTTLAYPTSYQHARADKRGATKLGSGRSMNVLALHVLPAGRDVVLVSDEGIYLLNGAVGAAKRLYPLDDNFDAYLEDEGDEAPFSLAMKFANADISPSGDRITCGAMFKRGVMAGLAIFRNTNGDWRLDNTSQADAFFPIQAVFHATRPHIAFAACLYASLSNALKNTTFRIDLEGLAPGEVEGFAGGIAQEPGVVQTIASFGEGFLLGFDNGYVRWLGVEENLQLFGYVFVGGSIKHIDVMADGKGFVVASDAGLVSTFRLASEASRNLIATMPVTDESRYAFFRTYPPLVW